MNVTCEISSTDEFNFFNYSACNNTEVKTNFEMFTVVYIITILLSFPISSYVICLIIKGTGNGLAAEFFILNLSLCEIFYCVECFLASLFQICNTAMRVSDFLDGFSITARPLFQCLICVECYLAVVHPVTFLKYKPLRYRLMCCTAVWVTSFGICIFSLSTDYFPLLSLFFMFYVVQFFIFLFIQLFCCVAVLRALKQSGPGERGREREEENHMKRRAFYLILITTVSTVITYGPQITSEIFDWSFHLDSDILQSISYICYLFAGLVQPLLFLYRVGKLNFIKCH